MSTMVPNSCGGMRTASMTWIVPFDASMSVMTTRASFTITVPPSTEIVTISP